MSALCRAMADKGLNLSVVTTNDAGGNNHLNLTPNILHRRNGICVYYFECGFRYIKYKSSFYSKKLNKFLKENIEKYDLLHISSSRHWHGYLAGKLAKEKEIPYLITPHASLMKYWMNQIGHRNMKKLYTYVFDSHVIKNAAAIHFLCEGEREESIEYIKNRPSFIIPNGINLNEFKRDLQLRVKLREKYNIKDDTITLLFLGRIHPQKNIHLILKALSNILERHDNPDILLFIVGEISDEKYYNKLKLLIDKNDLFSYVKMIPPVNKNAVVSWYSMSDYLMMPSIVEGVSMTLIEAMACSLPVIISDRVGNYREIMDDHAGYVISPHVDSLTEILHMIINNKSRQKLEENARKSAEKRYDIDKTSSLMIQAYHDIVLSKKSREINWK